MRGVLGYISQMSETAGVTYRMAPPWSILLLVALVGAQNTQEGATRALPMISNVACTKQMGCPDEYSCVMTPGDGSACCPLAQGTACQDGRHCCPLGTHCSEDGHSCLPASNLSAIICPDGASECPSGSTCCQMPSGSWGCCPLEQATCCNDHVHCCPHNTKCDLVHGTCNLHNEVFPMSKKVPARMKLQSSAKVLRTQCNDGSSCPDGSTCCQLGDKTFGCCPLMSAVCCGDHLHCCPSGTSCDIPHKKCTSKDSETPMVEKIPALREEATVRCNATAVCPGSTTCCRLSSGDWGCCPFEKAVCCADKVHCCPSGFTCTGSGCAKDQDSIPWLEKMPALKEEGNNVPCDPTSFCPDKTTCCRLPSGQWGCCPIEKAVCCSDHEHCCPSGYTCDVLSQTCNKPTDQPSLAIAPVGYVWCDNAHYCYDGQTCCRGPYGWACCPYTQGVCCPDRVHCCPYGHICLNQGAQCSQSDTPQWDLGWLKKKLPAKMFP